MIAVSSSPHNTPSRFPSLARLTDPAVSSLSIYPGPGSATVLPQPARRPQSLHLFSSIPPCESRRSLLETRSSEAVLPLTLPRIAATALRLQLQTAGGGVACQKWASQIQLTTAKCKCKQGGGGVEAIPPHSQGSSPPPRHPRTVVTSRPRCIANHDAEHPCPSGKGQQRRSSLLAI